MAAKFKVGDRVFLSRNGWCLVVEPVVAGQPSPSYTVQMVDGGSVYSKIPESQLSFVAS